MIHLLIQQYTDYTVYEDCQRISMFFNAMCLFSLDFNSFFIPSFVTSQSKLDLYYHEFFPIQLSSRIW